MIQGIVFDFDGVVVDSEPLHFRALLEVGQTFGAAFDYDDYMKRYVGFDDRDAFKAMLTDAGQPERAGDSALVRALCEQKQLAFERAVAAGVEPMAGVVALIRQCAAALPTAIASGATRRDIDLILDQLGLADCFQVIVTADDVARSKPDPASYRLAVDKLGRPAKDCLAIEDTDAGLESARSAGLWTLGVAGTLPADQLAIAHRVVDSLEGVGLAQLREWFE